MGPASAISAPALVATVPGDLIYTDSASWTNIGQCCRAQAVYTGAQRGPARIREVLQDTLDTGVPLRSQPVALYRSDDAEEVLCKDVIPMDKTGFHLTVIGTRRPDYAR